MKNYILSTLVLFFIGINVFGQAPSWSVNENNFQYTMSFVSFLNVDGTELSSENDQIAAFVNGECRGVTNLTFVESTSSYFAYLTVFSNVNSEEISFKIYDSQNDSVKDVAETKVFEINEHYGDLFQAFSFASPALSNEAEILDFGLKVVGVNDKIMNGTNITLDINNGENITDLNTTFSLSSGANLFIGTTKQVSGENSIDFSNPVTFIVRSEDQSVVKEWTVVVNRSVGVATFYKKDAVCYTGGEIKIVFTENNVEAFLLKDGVNYATQTISNGEAIFSNLEVGSYRVKVSANNKDITINLKE